MSMEPLRCPACRNPVTPQMRFCVHCGQKLLAHGTDDSAKSNTAQAQPVSGHSAFPGPEPVLPHTSSTAPVLRYAGFWRRLAAWLIDQIILGIALTVISAIYVVGTSITLYRSDPTLWSQFAVNLSDPSADVSADPLPAAFGFAIACGIIFTSVVGHWLYYAIFESSPWQATLGKRAIGLRVTDLQGRRISFGRATGRYFAKLISRVLLDIGFLMAAFTRRKQALHDLIADCLVVREGH
jgi:uncharacterized RDD family membrane protein YckC